MSALHDNVLTQPEFLDYAEKNLELVEIDIPIDKPAELANQLLYEKYEVQGLPTIIVTDATGNIQHRHESYGHENAKTFTTNLKTALGR